MCLTHLSSASSSSAFPSHLAKKRKKTWNTNCDRQEHLLHTLYLTIFNSIAEKQMNAFLSQSTAKAAIYNHPLHGAEKSGRKDQVHGQGHVGEKSCMFVARFDTVSKFFIRNKADQADSPKEANFEEIIPPCIYCHKNWKWKCAVS